MVNVTATRPDTVDRRRVLFGGRLRDRHGDERARTPLGRRETCGRMLVVVEHW